MLEGNAHLHLTFKYVTLYIVYEFGNAVSLAAVYDLLVNVALPAITHI